MTIENFVIKINKILQYIFITLLQRNRPMGILSNIFGNRSTADSGAQVPVLISTHTSSAEDIWTDDAAMRITTVYSCVRLIADTIGTLPIHVKRKNGNARELVNDHPVAKLLRKPSPLHNRIDLLRAIVSSEELAGNGYGYIVERDKKGYPERVDFYPADQVQIMVGDNDIFYRILPLKTTVASRDIIHFRGYAPDGIEGKSPIGLLRDEMENCRNTTKFSKELYRRDLRTAGVFSTDKQLGSDTAESLFKSLSKMIRRAKTTGAPIILEEGLKYSPIQLSPEDAQFVATKLQSIDQVASAFRVPPHKVGDLTRGTYSNNEQGNIEFYIDCIRPKLVQLEEELGRKLFLESEQDEYYIEIDFRGLFRADTQARKDMYKEMFYIGVYSPNEIRALEDLPPYEGGDQYYVPVNMVESKNNTVNE